MIALFQTFYHCLEKAVMTYHAQKFIIAIDIVYAIIIIETLKPKLRGFVRGHL
jgi:hypothetical protein